MLGSLARPTCLRARPCRPRRACGVGTRREDGRRAGLVGLRPAEDRSPCRVLHEDALARVRQEARVLMREWFAYDLDRKLMDRRLVLGDDLDTARIELPPGRSTPNLRFVYAADSV